jgi:hypothetical protein
MPDSVVFVAVLYYDNGWPAHMLKSFRQHFPTEPLLLVDHLPDDVDLAPEFLSDKHCWITHNPRGHNAGGHGGGMDAAADYLRSRKVKYMVHIEPDCTFTGREWFDSMMEAVQNGAIMAGPNQYPYGPIHPCPSIWNVDAIPCSFKTDYKYHPPTIYDARKQAGWLAQQDWPPEAFHAHMAIWDTGLKAWGLAAQQGKAVVTSGVGIVHHWEGRNKPVTSVQQLTTCPQSTL